MQTLPRTVHGQGDAFLATQWSVIVAAGESEADTERSRAALAQLCQTYWPPLYTYVRAQGYPRHDAQDLTQSFFAYLIEHRIYTRTDRQKGKFRSFLLASLKNFLANARDHDQALKRGGGQTFVPLDEGKADEFESLFAGRAQPFSTLPGDHLFERSWAETLVATALEALAAAYAAEGKGTVFSQLKTFLTAGSSPLPTYAELAERLAVAESTLRSHVTRLRIRYRVMLRNEVRRTVAAEAEVDAELRELLRVLST